MKHAVSKQFMRNIVEKFIIHEYTNWDSNYFCILCSKRLSGSYQDGWEHLCDYHEDRLTLEGLAI